MDTVNYTLNGTRFTFSEKTGALVSLWNEGCGEIVKDGRGLIDVAWPVKYDYETLRADPCGKHKLCAPIITADDRQITIHYPALPWNTVMPDMPCLEGGISATIYLTAWEDGRSIGLRCHVQNNSDTPIRQILFPDLSGLQPIAGDNGTRFTGLSGYVLPFKELKDEGQMKEQFFGTKPSLAGRFYSAGGLCGDSLRMGRYFDYGGLNGGLTMYTRHWGYGPDDPNVMGTQDVVWVKLNNLNHTLRIAGVHYPTLNKGECYDSVFYVLTPHAGGWVQGIQSYKAWVDQNKNRVVPPSKRVREMLGFRTIWATTQYDLDDEAVAWSYDQYGIVADDMLEHGLNSLNLWGWYRMMLPLTPERFFPKQGGFEGFKKAVQTLRQKGVDLVPLVSWYSIWDEMKERYGFERNNGATGGWNETLKGIPAFGTPYMDRQNCAVMVNQHTPLWIKDVKDALRFLRDQCGVYSICWDQYILDNYVLYDIIKEYRTETQTMYPDADFSGESTFYFEAEIDQIDYTWNWNYQGTHGNFFFAPYLYVVETTRPQLNVDSNPVSVKYYFMDNIMMNVYPSKPDNVNGSALIADYPDLSKAVKQCAALRKIYLDFFLNGKIVGDCVLSEDCTDARVTGYIKDDSALVYVVKHHDADAVLKLDLTPFIQADVFDITVYDADHQQVSTLTWHTGDALVISGAADELFAVECNAHASL